MPRSSPNEWTVTPGRDPTEDRASAMLVTFLHERDVPCPRCSYNLRNLTKPICPECQEPLLLKVGGRTYPIRWLLATVAPGIFTGVTSGIMAVMFLIALTVGNVGPPFSVPLGVILTGSFFLVSAAVAVAIIIWNRRFVRQPQPRQVMWAVLLWVIHLCAFFLFLSYILLP